MRVTSLEPVLVAPPAFAPHTTRLNSACKLAQIAEFAASDVGPVAAVAFDAEAQQLVVAHASTNEAPGQVLRWALTEGTLAAIHNLGPATVVKAQFDASGRLLGAIGGGDAVGSDLEGRGRGVRVWDTRSGEVVRELVPDARVNDLALSADGDWLLSGGPTLCLGLDPLDPTRSEEKKGLLLWAEAEMKTCARGVRVPVAVALDAVGAIRAYGTVEGDVGLWQDGPEILVGWRGRARVLDLEFDRARRYLAILREDSLVVSNLAVPLHLAEAQARSLPVEYGAIAFDPTGSLLAVATNDGWQLRETRSLQIVAQGGDSATAVAFSPDGCLLSLGDEAGVVRLYACAPSQRD
ncbi:MAG: hypothetical protein K6V36_16285 [Anaerolineae bacterium]|nr:hypothetical protein [Anaerolineae bacterium]